MQNLKKSKAFSLLELVIAIVVIGIVALSLPLMLQSTVSIFKTSSKEEIIYQEFSLLQLVNSLYFDENNTEDDNYYKDLNATKGDDELLIIKYSEDEYNRIGKHQMNNNILRSGTNSTVSKIGVDDNESSEEDYDDIDDYDGFEENVTTNFGQITLKVKVMYIDDEAEYNKSKFSFTFNYENEKNATNIKLIKVYTTVDSQNISLSYPAMNIGRSKFLSLEEISE